MKPNIFLLGCICIAVLLLICSGCGSGNYHDEVMRNHEWQKRQLAEQRSSTRQWTYNHQTQAKANAAARVNAGRARSQAQQQAQISRFK